MKRALIKLLALAALLLMLCGCFEKDFENTAIIMRGAKTLDFSTDKTVTVSVELPSNPVPPTLLVSTSSEALSAVLTDDGKLTLSSSTPGEYKLILKLEAKGYKSVETRYPVKVTLPAMTVSVTSEGGDASRGLAIARDATSLLEVSSNAANAQYSLTGYDEALLSVSKTDGGFELSALSPGETSLTLSVTADGYEPYEAVIPVRVKKVPAKLFLSQTGASAVLGGAAKISCEYQRDAVISAACENDAAEIFIDGGDISVKSSKAGSYTVNVTCEADGYETASASFTAVFKNPAVAFSAPASVSLVSGTQTVVSLSGYPAGTTFSASPSSRITAAVSGDKITVTAEAAGSAALTVTASCAGYEASSVTIPVTVSAISVEVETQYSAYAKQVVALTNVERAKYGLSQLYYAADLAQACQVRANEAAEKWAHTRPDGRSWETVLYDLGIYYYGAGENLLEANELDPQRAVLAWMDSPGHRENILRPEFDGLCVGITHRGGYYYYSQIFIDGQ